MKFVCLWSPDWSIAAEPASELMAALLEVAPRVVVDGRGLVWVEGTAGWSRGREDPGRSEEEVAPVHAAFRLAGELLDRVAALGVSGTSAGVSAVPVAAALAARSGGAERGSAPGGAGRGAEEAGESAFADGSGGDGRGVSARITLVEPGRERSFLASLPLDLLEPEDHLRSLLEGVGIKTCGELAALDREAVEVRFGDAGVALWRLARADDVRRIFAPFPRERPHASLDFVDYVLTDPARLVFTANALLGNICGELWERGEHAQRMRLSLGLANGEVWSRSFRPARPTARREVWLRLVRAALERLTVPDAVSSVSLEVEATELAAVHQGDLFDRGFATATAVEAALERLTDSHGPVIVAPELSAHPLLERRTRWIPRSPGGVVEATPAPQPAGSGPTAGRVGLSLQLLPSPRRIAVEASPRRDHIVPVRYRGQREWLELIAAAGPDRISGGAWEEPYAREYFRCVDAEGGLLWIFRDAREEGWYLHGWWS